MSTIPVIDLFAGPGGLGEGFSSLGEKFRIAVSIEKEASAHRTLLLRAFYRQFSEIPDAYYDFLKGKLGEKPEEILYGMFRRASGCSKRSQVLNAWKNGNQEIFDAIDTAVGNKPCILIGGPPCQAYSLVGRARNKGIEGYKAEADHRNFLYQDYLQIIARYQPMVFVMENVKGMLSAKVGGNPIFNQIMEDLHNPATATNTSPAFRRKAHGYRIFPLAAPVLDQNPSDEQQPSDFIIHAERFGVPQKRHRVILLGIRQDLANRWDSTLAIQPQGVSVELESVIRDLPPLRSGFSKQENTQKLWRDYLTKRSSYLSKNLRSEGLQEVAKAFSSFPSRLKTLSNEQGKNLGLKKDSRIKLSCHMELRTWLLKERMEGYVTNHQSRGHMAADLDRYLFCSLWAEQAREKQWDSPFPKSGDYPDVLKPAHKNFDSGKFSDRFRVQVAHQPATTVTSHISKDGHYFIHYDPTQCRSLTVREAARIQSFPDDYFFVGNRTEQFVQVGNAVPPWLARKIATKVSQLLQL